MSPVGYAVVVCSVDGWLRLIVTGNAITVAPPNDKPIKESGRPKNKIAYLRQWVVGSRFKYTLDLFKLIQCPSIDFFYIPPEAIPTQPNKLHSVDFPSVDPNPAKKN
jgi:hypothetical protein